MISILMPIYNGIEFIQESVSSVIAQTFQHWELIIGINGHELNSKVYDIARQYENVDGRIKVLDLYFLKGKATALNHMIMSCVYDYVALLDVDDIWYHDKLEIQSVFIHHYDVVGSKCVYFGDIENVVPIIPSGDLSGFDFKSVNPIINSSCIIKKESCYWNENGIEDYDLWLRLWKLGKKFYNCPRVLVRHRIHQLSSFNSKGHNEKKKLLFSIT